MNTPDMSVTPEVAAFFDPASNTISYVAKDPDGRACAVIDSVLDLDYAAGRIAFDSAEKIAAFVEQNGLAVEWLIETHMHADHLSAAPYLQRRRQGVQ